jgi:choice-of-anchor B domain-containing protein
MKKGTSFMVVALALTIVVLGDASPALGQSVPGSVAQQAGFGRAVAVGESSIFVGESNNNTKPGVVHVFERAVRMGSWKQYAEIRAESGTIGDGFGQAVSASGSTLLVGGSGTDNAGAAFVFTRSDNGGWTQTAVLSPGMVEAGSLFGSHVSINGDLAVIGAPGANDRTGAAFVFSRDGNGMWSTASAITGSDAEAGDRFASAVYTDGRNVFVGSPRHNAGDGAAYAFAWDDASSSWKQTTKLGGADAGEGGFFGTSFAVHGPHLMVGAPRTNEGAGAVVGYQSSADGWSLMQVVSPDSSGDRGLFFGQALAVAGNDLIVGMPGANARAGSAVVYTFGVGEIIGKPITPNNLDSRDGFASSLAAAGDVFVAGVIGDDFGSGSGRVFERVDGAWTEAVAIMGKADNLMAVSGGKVDCADGMASEFGCEQVDLLSFVPVDELGGGRGVRVNDVWGWTDPETDREYAIVGRLDGTSFVDVTDPNNPVYKGNLPRTEGTPASTWRDMKTYKNHVFIVADGASDHGMQVLDLTQLRNVGAEPVTFTETTHYDKIASAHNIVINEDTGYAFTVGNSSGGETCGGGLHIINIQDPVNPEFVGCFADPSTGRSGTGYSHDAMCITYNGPDTEHRSKEICFGSNETALSIADVSDKNAPVALSSATYPNVGYAHQGWITDDHRFFYLNDELDEISGKVDGTRTMIWDASDLDDPQLVREYMSANKSSDHNLYIKGNFMYQSNYQSGLRIFDISDAANPVPVGYFDTVPYGEDTPGFGGSWSNYPFFKSGIVLVTSGNEGLFVVKKRQVDI